MSGLATTLGPSAYWYLTRGSGVVALLLLTASLVLGILGPLRFSAPRWPRFAVETLHRDVSLLALAFVVIHVVTTVLDGFAPISLIDGVIPFLSPYRPLWLGLGTVAFDVMLALIITSLLRRRLGFRTWRAVHWLSYASWPIAVLHTLGTGSDARVWWLILLTVACAAAVVAAALARIGQAQHARPRVRTGAIALSILTPLGIAIFALQGPLAHGWAARAGTPAKLLGAHPAATRTPVVLRGVSQPFSGRVSGRISQTSAESGAIVELRMAVNGGVSGKMRVRMGGQPLPEGGLSLTGSQVDLSLAGIPAVYAGKIQSLQGAHFQAHVVNAYRSGLELSVSLHIDAQASTVTGTVSGTPTGAAR